MNSDLHKLQIEIEDSVRLIDSRLTKELHQSIYSKQSLENSEDIFNATSLLEKCNSVYNQYLENKPKIRTIHHFACSGGTLISKCLSVMPNVYLLSELHPYSSFHIRNSSPKFSPTDISSLSIYANIPHQKELSINLFKNNIKTTLTHVRNYGGTLLLRDHTHSDFCLGKIDADLPTLVSTLEREFTLISIITLRDPIDSYLSLVSNKWVKFLPATFDEYCRRLLLFLSSYKNSKIFKYEDFVQNPINQMKQMCIQLDMPFNDSFIDIFEISKVTGDSGRKSNKISPRNRKEISTQFSQEIKNSENYAIFCQKNNYTFFEDNL